MSKPRRVLLLQALCVIQFGILGMGTGSAIAALPPDFPAADLALGLVKPLCGVTLVLGLLLSLQRYTPRPGTVAPVTAGVWWFSAFCLAVVTWHEHHRSALALLGKLAFHAVLLWLLVLVFADGKTRAYLSRVSSIDRHPES